jgi:hypothetical protein
MRWLLLHPKGRVLSYELEQPGYAAEEDHSTNQNHFQRKDALSGWP